MIYEEMQGPISLGEENNESNEMPHQAESVPAAYETFRSRHKILDTESYDHAVEAAQDPAVILNETYRKNVVAYARPAAFKLAPDTIALYAILRDRSGSDERSEELADHHLLAEVLYHQGKYDELEAFVNAYPEVFHQ